MSVKLQIGLLLIGYLNQYLYLVVKP